MISETLIRFAKKEALFLPLYTAIAILAVHRAIRTNNKNKQKDKQMGIKFHKLVDAAVNETTSTIDRGLKVSEYNYIELANYIHYTNVGAKEAFSKVHVNAAGDESKHRISVPTKKGPRVAAVGDVVVRTVVPVVRGEDGVSRYHEYYVIKAADFAGYAK